MKSNFDSCDKLKRKGWNDLYVCDRSAHMHAMHIEQSVSQLVVIVFVTTIAITATDTDGTWPHTLLSLKLQFLHIFLLFLLFFFPLLSFTHSFRSAKTKWIKFSSALWIYFLSFNIHAEI